MLMQIKDYARSRGISYEAVRRQVTKYEKELQGHLQKNGKAVLLDDKACEILDGHRHKKMVTVVPTDNMVNEQLKQYENEISQLKSQIIALQNDKLRYIEDKAKTDTLLALADKEHNELEQTKQELYKSGLDLNQARQELEQARQDLEQKDVELNKYTRTIFGLYRKV